MRVQFDCIPPYVIFYYLEDGILIKFPGIWSGCLVLCLFTAGCGLKQPGANGGDATVTLASAAAETANRFSLFRTDSPFELVKPVQGPITSRFGIRRHPTKKRKIFHRGVDIDGDRGDPVVAAGSGIVSFTGYRGRGYGKTVEVTHDNGAMTRYTHLDAILVKMGERVTPERQIGHVGRTGRTTGPHLHLELWVDGKPVDPVPHWNASPWRKAEALVLQQVKNQKKAAQDG